MKRGEIIAVTVGAVLLLAIVGFLIWLFIDLSQSHTPNDSQILGGTVLIDGTSFTTPVLLGLTKYKLTMQELNDQYQLTGNVYESPEYHP